ncbi:MAG: hypothetical protein E7166_02390 [Firmicutes bacterium]|nr:hypothetical protein [Bacillota bacterium]
MQHTILPADTYIVVNKTILSDNDRKILTMLYQPIVGQLPISLYFTLWSDLDTLELMSVSYTHHHLMSTMKLNLSEIVEAREKLEAVGLLKTYIKEDENINNFIYEMYSPLSVDNFLNHPILNVVLFNNIGKKEYDKLVDYFKIPTISTKEFINITKSFTEIFESVPYTKFETVNEEIKKKNKNKLILKNEIDFSLLISSLPKGLVTNNTFNKEIRDLITNLAFVYNLGILDIENVVRISINEKGVINKNLLRKNCRNYYQFENNGKLPSLIYKNQPENLRQEINDISDKSKMIYIFETLSPYQFLKGKQNGAEPTSRDLKLLEILVTDYGLNPGVVNVLVDYVLKINNSKLTKSFVETIAGQWKRLNVLTVEEAINIAQKEYKKYNKTNKKVQTKNEANIPSWFNEKIEKDISAEEQKELDELLKEFR